MRRTGKRKEGWTYMYRETILAAALSSCLSSSSTVSASDSRTRSSFPAFRSASNSARASPSSPCNLQISTLSASLVTPNSSASLCSSAWRSSRASSVEVPLLSCPASLPSEACVPTAVVCEDDSFGGGGGG